MSKLGRFILPYCVKKDENNKSKYVILGRDYKPLGFNTQELIKYGSYPILYKLAMTPKKAAKLSWKNDSNVDAIVLYNDGTNPLNSDKDMKEYLKRLELLAKMVIKES